MRETPAWRARDLTQPLLPIEPVDLVDHAIDVERQVGARLLDRAIMGEHRLEIVAADEQVRDRNPKALDPLHCLMLRIAERLGKLAPAVGKNAQRPRGGDRRVLLAQRPRGGIAGVGEDLAASRLLSLVQSLEVSLRHVHFAAHFDHAGRAGDGLWDVADRSRVGGDVLTNRAVAAGRRQHQLAAFVTQRATEAVDLRFGRHGHDGVCGQIEETLHPPNEFADLFRRKCIFETEHAPGVSNLRKSRCGGRGTQPLRRRVRPHELRKALLELAILSDQRVVSRVGNLRRVLVVIELVVPRDFLRQPHQAIGRLGFGQGLSHPR